MSSVQLVSVGNLSHDIISISGREYRSLGGSSAYFSLTSSKMGFKTGIVSKIGVDFKKDYLSILRKNKVDLLGLKTSTEKTTSFKNIYVNWRRKQILISTCGQINPEDFPEEYFEAELVYFGPIYREITVELVGKVSGKGIKIALDIQGLCRRKFRNGVVIETRSRKVEKFIEKVDIVKAALSEAILITGERDVVKICRKLSRLGPEIVLLTLGEEGAIVFGGDSAFKIPSFKVNVVDPTGAGDAFTCGFITRYLSSGSLVEAALYGASTASFVVEGLGLENIPDAELVEKRIKLSNISATPL